MCNSGGSEGHAQTLRILARLEKRATLRGDADNPVMIDETGVDQRIGLNPTYRALAWVLRPDREIPRRKIDRDAGHRGPVEKGYYYTKSGIVAEIKRSLGHGGDKEFRTVECAIMDTADDIAYSTYDLEDAFKRIFTPVSIISIDEAKAERVCNTITARARRYYKDLPPTEWDFGVPRLLRHGAQPIREYIFLYRR